MNDYKRLINVVIGQLNGVNRMIENEDECFEVLAQLKASKAALNSITNKYLEENFTKCIQDENCSKEEICKKFFKEIIK